MNAQRNIVEIPVIVRGDTASKAGAMHTDEAKAMAASVRGGTALKMMTGLLTIAEVPVGVGEGAVLKRTGAIYRKEKDILASFGRDTVPKKTVVIRPKEPKVKAPVSVGEGTAPKETIANAYAKIELTGVERDATAGEVEFNDIKWMLCSGVPLAKIAIIVGTGVLYTGYAANSELQEVAGGYAMSAGLITSGVSLVKDKDNLGAVSKIGGVITIGAGVVVAVCTTYSAVHNKLQLPF